MPSNNKFLRRYFRKHTHKSQIYQNGWLSWKGINYHGDRSNMKDIDMSIISEFYCIVNKRKINSVFTEPFLSLFLFFSIPKYCLSVNFLWVGWYKLVESRDFCDNLLYNLAYIFRDLQDLLLFEIFHPYRTILL